jgi:two-component system, OmpR family, response regulator
VRILLVEDDETQGAAIKRRLGDAQFTCDWVRTTEDASAALRAYPYELVVLDRQLPDGDGIDLLRGPMAGKAQPRFLVLSSLGAPGMRTLGLKAGADDYMAKPFEYDELLARVRALLRRSKAAHTAILQLGNVDLDMSECQVSCGGVPLLLPRREYLILQTLMLRAERLTTRQALENAVYNMEDTRESNTLDAQISRLRRRLREHAAGVRIVAMRGIGYILTAQEEPHDSDQ